MKKWVFSPRVALGNVDSDDEFEEPRFNKKRAKKRKLDNSPPPPPIKVFFNIDCVLTTISGAQFVK